MYASPPSKGHDMDVSNPLRAVAPGVEGDVLAVLVPSHVPLTGARVGDLADRSHTQVRDVLRRLEQRGLVVCERYGNSYTYLLNRQHVLAEALESLASALNRVEQRIIELVRGWEQPAVGVVLFGSFARRDGGPESDIDLLVVRPSSIDEDDRGWVEQRYLLSQQLEAWTGNRAQIVDLSEEELAEAVEADEPLIESLRADGIALVGDLQKLLPARTEARAR